MSCANCGQPFTGTPWRYGSKGREHVDCQAESPFRTADGAARTLPPIDQTFTIEPGRSRPSSAEVRVGLGPKSKRGRPRAPARGRKGGGRQCAAIKKGGQRCGGGAMPGSPYCGPHQR